jgi:prepilin-type N-terminal cleavage/methylation domain-containing protein
MKMPNRSSAQRGFSLIEMMVVLGIVAVLMLGYWALKRDDSTSLKNAGVAAALAKVSDAAQAYAKANTTSLLAAAGPTTSVTVTIPQLIAGGGHLDPSFPTLNAYNQTWRVRYIEPSPGNLQALVDSYGGATLNFDSLAEIAQMAVKDGAPAGIISSTAPFSGAPAGCSGASANYARGVFGDWCVMLANFGGSPGNGHLAAAVFYADASTNDDFLHRTANADHQLNSMSTNIDMQGHSLDNVSVINIPGGGNGVNLGGSYLYGDAQNIALRPRSGNVYFQNLAGAAGNIVQVHNISGDSTSTFTASDVSAADTLYAGNQVVSAGNITAAGSSYASNWFRSYGATGWYNQTYGGGWYMADSTWLRSYGNKNVYTGGEIQGGTIHSLGDVVADGAVVVKSKRAEGSGCATYGAIAQSSNGTGELVVCQSGRWTAVGGGYSSFTIVTSPNVSVGNSDVYATCPAGYVLLSGGYTSYTTNFQLPTGPAMSRPASASSWVVRSADLKYNSQFYAHAFCAK